MSDDGRDRYEYLNKMFFFSSIIRIIFQWKRWKLSCSTWDRWAKLELVPTIENTWNQISHSPGSIFLKENLKNKRIREWMVIVNSNLRASIAKSIDYSEEKKTLNSLFRWTIPLKFINGVNTRNKYASSNVYLKRFVANDEVQLVASS